MKLPKRKFSTLVALGMLVLLTACGDSSKPAASVDPTTSSSHAGMVEGTVWVANESGNSISVIDTASNQILTTLTGVEGPHNLQVSPDGKSVWAVSGHASLAAMIDPVTYKLHGTVPTGKEPAHIVLAPDGKTAYTTNGADNTVTAIDVASMKAIAQIPAGKYPHGLRPSPDGKWLYVANAKDTTLSVIETATNTKVADIQVGQSPVQVGFSPDGKYVYFSLNGENALGKVEVATRKLVGKVKVGNGPVQVFVTPDNKSVLVANQGTKDNPGTTASIVDTATFTLKTTVETGKGAHGVTVDPSGKHAYITNIYGNDVAVLDLEQERVVARVASGQGPNGISFSAVKPGPVPASQIELPLPHHDENMPDMNH
ncbi:MAG TPA: beta-propeller fold lactonase family protein [Chloroflexia bacterium]|nr:beta-propeller fold lactonase family protein [Chloroflexia bacterium]